MLNLNNKVYNLQDKRTLKEGVELYQRFTSRIEQTDSILKNLMLSKDNLDWFVEWHSKREEMREEMLLHTTGFDNDSAEEWKVFIELMKKSLVHDREFYLKLADISFLCIDDNS